MTPSLRERKLARTRLALLDAFVARLDERPLEAIPVKELCAAVEISEGTFFNLFENKGELVAYFVQVWSLELGARVQEVLATRGAKAAIAAVFEGTADAVAAHPRVMAEVIAAQARLEHPVQPRPLSLAERLQRLGPQPRLAELPAMGLDSLLPWLIGEAVARGELPASTDQSFLFLNLAAIFFGTPVALRATNPALVGPAWRRQVALLLEGG